MVEQHPHNFTILRNKTIKQITVDKKDKNKKRVEFEDGTFSEFDILISAIGIVPNSLFVPSRLLSPHGYVQVNDELQSAHPNVYASGDIAYLKNRKQNIQQFSEASYQGQVAA